jgi:CDP-diacylglycerol--glycerol-3-phosphate 3-phosphatidyltransferase
MAVPEILGIVILALLSELAGVLGWAIAHTRRYDGPMGKSDRAFIFGALGLGLGLGLEPGPWLTGIGLGVIILQLVTIGNRLRATLKEVQSCS